MPTTTKITKEMILNTAFEIAREKGFEKISNRELAKKMNCSIRPIYYQFKNVEELNKELYKKIERYFYEFLIDNMIKDVPLYKQIGINYIKFAIAENNLFRFLFMTEIKDETSAFITTDKKGFEEVVKAIKISTKLSDKDIKSFHIKMWIFAHGIATLSATKSVKFTDEQIQDLLSQEFQALMLLEENPNNKWILKNNDEWKK
ncbi:MAG: TetR/AcrR family transcriptional regulator [Bacilli bacterium]|nr:TetR/AcrR family transcriptional regulator [Bacilli bacterium]